MNVLHLVPSVSRWLLSMGSLMLAAGLQQPVHASGVDLSKFRRIEPQYIAALGDPGATSGSGAQSWGLWSQDPGPRGCKLDRYDQLKAAGVAPSQWKFDATDWWLEEHGLIMEKPTFPLPPDGNQRWELAEGATLYDVTHLGCRSARYTPATANHSCSPADVRTTGFPVNPGAAMPVVNGCRKQDYAVLIVVGLPATH
jgi:hypothetical protein